MPKIFVSAKAISYLKDPTAESPYLFNVFVKPPHTKTVRSVVFALFLNMCLLEIHLWYSKDNWIAKLNVFQTLNITFKEFAYVTVLLMLQTMVLTTPYNAIVLLLTELSMMFIKIITVSCATQLLLLTLVWLLFYWMETVFAQKHQHLQLLHQLMC